MHTNLTDKAKDIVNIFKQWKWKPSSQQNTISKGSQAGHLWTHNMTAFHTLSFF